MKYEYHFTIIGKYGFDGKAVDIPIFNSIGQMWNFIAMVVILIKVM